MMREEIRRRALRAAAAVSLTVGALGCATEIESGAVMTSASRTDVRSDIGQA